MLEHRQERTGIRKRPERENLDKTFGLDRHMAYITNMVSESLQACQKKY